MKQYTIKIIDDNVYINDRLCHFDYPMDKTDKEDDLNEKAIVALVNEMGYEPVYLFEEMADRLDKMLDELKFD